MLFIVVIGGEGELGDFGRGGGGGGGRDRIVAGTGEREVDVHVILSIGFLSNLEAIWVKE